MRHVSHLLYGIHTRIEEAKWETLPEPFRWHTGAIIPAGAEFKRFETRDFGYVVLKTTEIAPNHHLTTRVYRE